MTITHQEAWRVRGGPRVIVPEEVEMVYDDTVDLDASFARLEAQGLIHAAVGRPDNLSAIVGVGRAT